MPSGTRRLDATGYTAQERPADVLAVQSLSVVYGTARGRISAVQDVSFDVAPGDAIGVVGESGCGKTALALAMVGLLPRNGRVSAGEVRLGDTELTKASKKVLRSVRGRRIAIVFQDSMTSLDPVITIGKQIAEGMLAHQALSRKDVQERAIALLDEVGVPEPGRRLRQYPHQLSGGLRQRVAIAVAIAAGPEILIADEPTTALDVTIQAQILDLLERERERRGMALVLITHDLGVVASVTDHLMVMYAGRVVESGDTRAIFASPRHPYTAGLLRSMPKIDGTGQRRLEAIPGAPPSGHDPAPGCPFAQRCAYVISTCRNEEPALQAVIGGTHSHKAACFVDVRNAEMG